MLAIGPWKTVCLIPRFATILGQRLRRLLRPCHRLESSSCHLNRLLCLPLYGSEEEDHLLLTLPNLPACPVGHTVQVVYLCVTMSLGRFIMHAILNALSVSLSLSQFKSARKFRATTNPLLFFCSSNQNRDYFTSLHLTNNSTRMSTDKKWGSIKPDNRIVNSTERSASITTASGQPTATGKTTPIIESVHHSAPAPKGASLVMDPLTHSRAADLPLENESGGDQQLSSQQANVPSSKIKLESFRCKPTIVAECPRHCLLQIGPGYYIHINTQTGVIVKWLTVYGNVAFVSPGQLLVVFNSKNSLGLGAVYAMHSQEAVGYIKLGYGEQVFGANEDCVLTRTIDGETYFHKLADLTSDGHAVRFLLALKQEKITLSRSGCGFLSHQPARGTPERKLSFVAKKKDRESTLTAYSLERADGKIEYLKLSEVDGRVIMQTPFKLVRYDTKKKAVFVDSVDYTNRRIGSTEISSDVCHLPAAETNLCMYAMHHQCKVEAMTFDSDYNINTTKHGLLLRGPLPGNPMTIVCLAEDRLVTCSHTFSCISTMQESGEFVLCVTPSNVKSVSV